MINMPKKLFIYRKFLYMTMDIYSIYMRNDDPHGKVLYMQKLQFQKSFIYLARKGRRRKRRIGKKKIRRGKKEEEERKKRRYK